MPRCLRSRNVDVQSWEERPCESQCVCLCGVECLAPSSVQEILYIMLLGYVWCMSSRWLTLRVSLVLTYAVYANGAVMVAYGQQWRRRHGRLRIAGEALVTWTKDCLCSQQPKAWLLRCVHRSLSWNRARKKTMNAICNVRIWNTLWFFEGPTIWESLCKLEILVTYSYQVNPEWISMENCHWTIGTFDFCYCHRTWLGTSRPSCETKPHLVGRGSAVSSWAIESDRPNDRPSDSNWIQHDTWFLSQLWCFQRLWMIPCEGLNGHLLESSSDNWTWTFEDGRRSSAMERPLHKI